LPALLAWALAWLSYVGLRDLAPGPAWAWLVAALLGGAAALAVAGHWRRLLVAAGFPLSSLALGATAPAWVWLLAALALLLAYPLRAWADAPFFPTPERALLQLATALPLPPGARVLDAGCGLGHGLVALRAVWPQARIAGIEWSAPLAWLCARRCRYASVRRGDMWVLPWTGHDLVYLFQRPESMVRAWTKACTEMAPGRHLVSLEFAVPGVEPLLQLDAGGGRPLWVYRVPGRQASTTGRRGR
jgi:SAM-dependent methyltransferase